MNARGVCIQVEHSIFGTLKFSGLQINDVVITHGMFIATLSHRQKSDYENPIENSKIIMKDLLSAQTYNYSVFEPSLPIRFSVLSKNCSNILTKNEFAITHKHPKHYILNNYVAVKARICTVYKYRDLTDITHEISNWNYESNSGYIAQELVDNVLPVFIILTVNQPVASGIGMFEKTLNTESLKNVFNDIYPGLSLVIDSTPFGNVSLVNSWTQGIVSKVIGSENDGFLTDARLVAGCEGAPVFSFENGIKGSLVGIVIETSLHCNGEQCNLSLCLSVRHLLKRMLHLQSVRNCIPFNKSIIEISNSQVNMGKLCEAVVFVHCQHSWGSGVVIDATSGLILTCAHIIDHAKGPIKVLCKNGMVTGRIVYIPHSPTLYDLALVSVGPVRGLKHLEFADTPPMLGEKVLTVGYPLSTASQVTTSRKPTLSVGCVAKASRRGGPVQTTCLTHRGASGGALIRPPHYLLGIITSNMQTQHTYLPSFGFAMSVEHFRRPIHEYLTSRDPSCLQSLVIDNYAMLMEWELVDCKL